MYYPFHSHGRVPQLPDSLYPSLSDVIYRTDFLSPVLAAFLGNVLIYYSVSILLHKYFVTSRQKAWLLTLTSSSFIVVFALPLFVEFISLPPGSTINDLPSLHNAPVPYALSVYFVGYLFADIWVGVQHYPDQIGVVTGWIHHVGYFICVLNCLKYRIAGGFLCFASVLETPTIVLALGHIHRAWRKDLLFGGLFFITRIVLHAWIIHHVYSTYQSEFWIVTATPYPIHVYWFLNWTRQQIRKRIGRDIRAGDTPQRKST
ncbi:hypothetical protein BASA50_000710 [Batrachochytrium salamandrivorans]|uniref:TLC domain-containing protein n=1 Tax=Batrachochytrium salamandrivorans TaxID=1357716 RepID=A0ABQ8ETR3_9FUNG|nr:hypothetical protein BASA50_000710 [Batrachochytrium salamandrivorans]